MLTPEHRSKAPCIHAALAAARQGALAGGPTSAAAIQEAIAARIAGEDLSSRPCLKPGALWPRVPWLSGLAGEPITDTLRC